MKVDFSSLRSRGIGGVVERMKIKDSPAARGALAAKTFTLQRLFGIAVGRLVPDMPADPRFDPCAIGAQAVGL
ncbi:MAG TPA: hypothetical protein VFO57_05290 [Burkholderiales bacterium]|nr:hypothetical protein [Burkholderiales bacterium]